VNIVISGGTGFIGSSLVRAFTGRGHYVTVLTRGGTRRLALPRNAGVIACHSTERGSWQREVAEHDVVINLAGASIFMRWTPKNKQAIVSSRVMTTGNLVEAVAMRKGKETHFINVSGVGYYGYHGDEVLDENAAPGEDFLATVAKQWESAAMSATQSGARLVICRLGHVLGNGGGVLPKLRTLSRLHLGSHWGSGRQWVSWIHEEDMTRAFLYLLERKEISGPVNVTASNPVRNSELMKTLTRLIRSKPVIPHVPGFMLRLLTGEFATAFLEGQRVLPQALLRSGFVYSYSFLDEALGELLADK